ncbi:hypothetical protein FRB94_002005 [Tulasnella sp. JGI-2019a]|nr:hypothetical protein FRB93_003768 [Tulasnella sp. JGI-2019a]KAG9004838.1 hypothetical protein FRB94_002005 [Tulasnella sp. JGI-2019a]KAG9032149.1 hypothetical protein FRB95_001856 [Tulasnella sp. JGI-2019a]
MPATNNNDMTTANGNKVERPPWLGRDVAVFSVGNVITLIVVALLLVAFLFWVARPYLPFRHQGPHLPIQNPPTTRQHPPVISSPLTGPKGSIWGEWPFQQGPAVVGDEEVGLGQIERKSEGDWEDRTVSFVSDDYDTVALLVPPESAFIPQKRHTYHQPGLRPPFKNLVDPFRRQQRAPYSNLPHQPRTVAADRRPSTAC